MANHGGATPLPRAHRPRAPIMNAAPPRTAPLAPLRSSPTAVTLTLPRPAEERAANEYVEAPFRAAPPTARPFPPPPVSKQPAAGAASYRKDPPPECAAAATRSIVCARCGRCRCDSCQQPRPLPHKWVFNDSCLVSADSLIDYVSCLCCVKGLYYHCGDADGGESCADDPCACAPHRRAARWGCLAALSCLLPCLWLYWPLRGCKRTVEGCYARRSRTGCRCGPPPPTVRPALADKRLLDASPEF